MISVLDGVGAAQKKAPEKVYALRLDVAGTTPRIWRRLLARGYQDREDRAFGKEDDVSALPLG